VKVVIDLIGRLPADLDSLGARDALGPTRGDGHAISQADIRLFETEL
jgi:5'-methylthioadenosine phosphorylase